MNRQIHFGGRKLYATIIFSVIATIVLIIHGTFFDLDISEISRLSLGGFLATFVLVFAGLLVLEWIFSLDENEKILEIERKISKIGRKKK